ncbi:glycosyltransferase [Sphingobacterium populi]|uniref:Glycosyltransferase n=2 Tax=Sphingobacterium populi TaxID=1812824 RepID=A0ABW5UAW2_9SPHI
MPINFFFSIIVPIYNVEKYLYRCVDSLQSQIFKDFEVVFINDGSTDGSLIQLKNQLESVSFQYQLIEQSNQGLSAARNVGFTHTSGKFILFLDSDDYLQPDALSYLFDKLQSYSNIDYMAFARNYVDEAYKPIQRSFVKYEFEEEEKIFKHHEVLHSLLSFRNISFTVIDKVFARDFLVQFSPFIFKVGVNFEDHIFTFFTTKNVNQVLVSRRPLLNYLVRSTSIMRTADQKMVNNYIIMLREFIENMRLYTNRSSENRLILQHVLVQVASFYKALYDVKTLNAKDYQKLSNSFKQKLIEYKLWGAINSNFSVLKNITALYIRSPLSSYQLFNNLFFKILSFLGKG